MTLSRAHAACAAAVIATAPLPALAQGGRPPTTIYVEERIVEHGDASNHVRVFTLDANQGEYLSTKIKP